MEKAVFHVYIAAVKCKSMAHTHLCILADLKKFWLIEAGSGRNQAFSI